MVIATVLQDVLCSHCYSSAGCAVWSLLQFCRMCCVVIATVLPDVLCSLLSFVTGTPGGWFKAKLLVHVLVQLVVSGSKTMDDHLFQP